MLVPGTQEAGFLMACSLNLIIMKYQPRSLRVNCGLFAYSTELYIHLQKKGIRQMIVEKFE